MSQTYFDHLNYTMSNEDTYLEYQILSNNTEHVLCVAGSGSRVLPLFAKSPKAMSISDFSIEQLALTATRIETVRQLDHQTFLQFWGYPTETQMKPQKRQSIFNSLHLSEQYTQIMTAIFKKNFWYPLIYSGKYETMILKLSSIIQKIMGKHILKLASISNYSEFSSYLTEDFPRFRWKILIHLLGNSTLFNALLYKGSHPQKNIDSSYAKYYQNMFNSLFSFLIPKQSFFLQLLLFGKVIDIKGAPFEADSAIFDDMKNGIKNCEINYYTGNLFEKLEEIELKGKVDFVSFSDIPSYFPKDFGQDYLQQIKKHLNPDAITVHRYYFHINKNINIDGFIKTTNQYLDLIKKEKTQIYIIDTYKRVLNE